MKSTTYLFTIFTFLVTIQSLNAYSARALYAKRILTKDEITQKKETESKSTVIDNTVDQRTNTSAKKSNKIPDSESQDSSPSVHSVDAKSNNKIIPATLNNNETKKIELDHPEHSSCNSQLDDTSNQTDQKSKVTEKIEMSQISQEDKIEETIIETKSKVLNKESREEDSEEGVKLMSALVSFIFFTALF